ncbi:major facilitator superfamily domain-containing protein [Melampsora americana]|nr:major facilitator superfamily domain-containing protein [Melampsora americana]
MKREVDPEDAADTGTDSEHIVPKNNLPLVYTGLMLAYYLFIADQLMTAIALPSIAADLDGSNKYSWIGVAYLLAASVLNPLYGRLSDVLGRKPVLLGSIFIFLLGSGFCGGAQGINTMISFRAIQGLGGGGLYQLVQIVIADITTLEERGMFAGCTGLISIVAAIVAPLVGGILLDHFTWRWVFFINIPIGAASMALLLFCLKLPTPQKKSLRAHIALFDFFGLFLIVLASTLILIGFEFSETDWRSPTTIFCLCMGVIMLGLLLIFENRTSRIPIIPPVIFKTLTPALILNCEFTQSIVYTTASYYLPLYYEALGVNATMVGVKMMAFSVGADLFSVIAGIVLSKLHDYRPIIWLGWGFTALGCGLMARLDEHSSTGVQAIYTLILSFGIGLLFIPPLVALHSAMPFSEMASSTATYMLMRGLGSTLGISIGHTIFTSRLTYNLKKISKREGFDFSKVVMTLKRDVHQLAKIEPVKMRNDILHEYTMSISTIWVVCFALSLFGLFSGQFNSLHEHLIPF